MGERKEVMYGQLKKTSKVSKVKEGSKERKTTIVIVIKCSIFVPRGYEHDVLID